jgi:tRNA A-37 threonylcarbamoyl transferase component Bud32
VNEIPLIGGRVTPGVVLVDETVRRPLRARSEFVHALLAHLEAAGFEAAPRLLGIDEDGREILSYMPGTVPLDLQPDHPDSTLAAAARLIRRYHDATAGSMLAGTEEVVCHNDLSPCNFVFRGAEPVGLIDFDAAAPGPRVRDLGYALFLWLNLGTDGPDVGEQLRRARVFLDAYGLEERTRVVDAIVSVQREGIERVRDPLKPHARAWWEEQLAWVERNRDALERGL